ncbi:hypothetical protein PGTUg99_009450 [Puccinia graminis f. sp. tritici]|uniref:Uncharacterized protein n=2 Tax=Puccinia graminis f. sp. tritici TaxID=56615 RepID=E3KJY2_PUCGT|nr:uncharacterized protein PGTG_10766 [Puccinia graminis f. sp. tritici CRL 75-36-700-3]EFP84607.1 hypothetical protein PGTG_10766 [Puccinia graminis f. sp. tritici CRL 75-36-700-3]KAA1088627.1 hypothetical protein PGTUg99_009450 [Puccinia graminis f. sp. tritici]
MLTNSLSNSTISFCFSPDTSISSFTSCGSHLAVLGELVQCEEEYKAALRVPISLQNALAPLLDMKTTAHPIIQRDWYQEAEIGLILYLAGTSSASSEEQSASLCQYSLALEASLYAEENRKLAGQTKLSPTSIIKSIKNWWISS